MAREALWDAPEIGALVKHARELGFVEMSALEELGERLRLDSAQLEALEGQLQAEGVEVRDDSGKPGVDRTARADGATGRRRTSAARARRDPAALWARRRRRAGTGEGDRAAAPAATCRRPRDRAVGA